MAMSSRRAFIGGIASTAVMISCVVTARAGKTPRIGFLGNSTAALEANLIRPWREGLRDFGSVEGQNVAVEYRWAEGRYERFPALIAELL